MEETIEIVKCDICGEKKDCERINYPIRFHTEQTEGRSCKPYVCMTKLDLCEECMNKVIKINATGAQGYNHYYVEK